MRWQQIGIFKFKNLTTNDRHDQLTRLMVLSLFILIIRDNYIVPQMYTPLEVRRFEYSFYYQQIAHRTLRISIKNLFQQNGKKILN